jgi:hypothetical protein
MAERTASPDGDQTILFPELDDSPEHKKILKLSTALKKIRDERKEALTESKDKEDGIQTDLVTAMHKAGIDAFRQEIGGTVIEVRIKPSSEKVAVKIKASDDDDEDDDSE